jgi:DNA-binding CsgD family transcriptional regulator/tetratricopeptide (TPR) repeat protein
VGGCTLEAVEALATILGDQASQVLDWVTSLSDKSLLHHAEPEGEEPRLMMLETIREYGLECLTASGEMELTRRAHAAYCLALAEQEERGLLYPQQTRKLARMEQEHANLRAAMDWLLERPEARERIEMALRLGAALCFSWIFSGACWRAEGWNFLERALAGSEGVAVRVRAKAFAYAGNMAAWLGHFERGEVFCQQSLALYREIDDRVGMGQAIWHWGLVALLRNDLAAARSRFEESMGFSSEANDKRYYSYGLSHLAMIDNSQGEYERARARTEESLVFFREVGDKLNIAISLQVLAGVIFSEDALAKAHAVAEESLALYREMGIKDREAGVLALLGDITLSQGDTATARSLVEESIILYEETGSQQFIAWWVLPILAAVEARQGNYTAARTLYEECLAFARKMDDKIAMAFYLLRLAGVFAAQGEFGWAVRLWGASEAMRTTMGTPLAPAYRPDYERAVAATRAHLGEQAFAAAWAEGRAMTPEQALAARGLVILPAPSPAEPSSISPIKQVVSYPDDLTVRQVEVLRLLAQGLTNQEIAKQLGITAQTVHAHLRSMYSKLSVTTRSAATRYAIEHQLV